MASGPLGYAWARWHPPALPQKSFKGRTVLVTGSNTGLGFDTARHYLALGATHIIMGVRSLSKGQAAQTRLEEESGKKGIISVMELDMSRFASVKAFAESVDRDFSRLDVAVLNAGVLNRTFQTSPEGWEESIQVNTLSTTLLALLLLPILKRSKSAQAMADEHGEDLPHLVIVSSESHGRINGSMAPFDKPNAEKDTFVCESSTRVSKGDIYKGTTQYAISKFLLMCSLAPLAHLADANGVILISCCPSFCYSNLARDFGDWWIRLMRFLIGWIFTRSTEEGARVIVSASTVGQEGQGGYWTENVLTEKNPFFKTPEGRRIAEQVWEETADILRAAVPEVGRILNV